MPPSTPAPEAFLPLRPLELLVLTMLADGPLHGYAIRLAILEHTGGSIEVEAANLYRHIRRLHAESLIDLVQPQNADSDDDRRRDFRLTPLGKRVVAAELARLRTLVRFGESRRLLTKERS